jgi:hypothetical protein
MLPEGHKIRNSNCLTLEDGEDNGHQDAGHWLKSPNKIYHHIKITLRAQADKPTSQSSHNDSRNNFYSEGESYVVGMH